MPAILPSGTKEPKVSGNLKHGGEEALAVAIRSGAQVFEIPTCETEDGLERCQAQIKACFNIVGQPQ